MNVIRIRRRIESSTLELPELASFLGKAVEILVLEDADHDGGTARRPVRFALDGSFDPELIGEAFAESGALHRLA